MARCQIIWEGGSKSPVMELLWVGQLENNLSEMQIPLGMLLGSRGGGAWNVNQGSN